MQDAELGPLLEQIRTRYAELEGSATRQARFLAHVRALGHWENDPMDYPDVTAEFPEAVQVAFAVCHPDCGRQEFIVEGGTQECQRCGRLMFRNSVQEYKRSDARR